MVVAYQKVLHRFRSSTLFQAISFHKSWLPLFRGLLCYSWLPSLRIRCLPKFLANSAACLLFCGMLMGCQKPIDEPLDDTIDQLFLDADVGTSSKLHTSADSDSLIELSPADLRKIDTRTKMGGQASTTCSIVDRKLVALWYGRRFSHLHAAEGFQKFSDQMESLFFNKYTEPDEIDAAIKRSAPNLTTTWKTRAAFEKRIGSSMQLVIVDSDAVEVKDYNSVIQYQWAISRPFQKKATVGEILELRSGYFRWDHLPQEFYDAIRGETVHQWRVGGSFSLHMNKGAAKRVAGALEANEFDFISERDFGKGLTIKTWVRYSDSTHASVRSQEGESIIQFGCGSPFRKEPRAKDAKRPSIHPMLKLPQTKRPLTDFEDLFFPNESTARTAKSFHDYAEQLAEKDWDVKRYSDARHQNDPWFIGEWRSKTEKKNGRSFVTVPHRSFLLRFKGKWNEQKIDELHSMEANLRWIPQNGLGVTVDHRFGLWFCSIYQVKQHVRAGDYLDQHSSRPLILDRVEAGHYVEGTTIRYGYQGSLGYTSDSRNRRFFEMFRSAQHLKSLLLEEIDRAREIASDQIRNWENVRVTAEPVPTGEVGGATEEVRIPDQLRSRNEKIIEKLEESATRNLDKRQQWVEKNSDAIFKAIHEAIKIEHFAPN